MVINLPNLFLVRHGHGLCKAKLILMQGWKWHVISQDRNEFSWWRHQMETFSALLALCAGNWPVTGEFPSQRPVTRRFSLICAGTNGCANNRDAGDLRRHRAHYDVVWKCFHGRVLIHPGSILIKSWRNVQCHYQFSTDSCKTPILLPDSIVFPSICTRWYWLVLIWCVVMTRHQGKNCNNGVAAVLH